MLHEPETAVDPHRVLLPLLLQTTTEASPARGALREIQEPRELQDLQVFRESRALMDPQGSRESKGPQLPEESREMLELQGSRERRERRETRWAHHILVCLQLVLGLDYSMCSTSYALVVHPGC